MSARRTVRCGLLLGLLGLGVAPGCASRSDAMRDLSELESGYGGDDIVALERALAQREQELRVRGLSVPSATPADSSATSLAGAADDGGGAVAPEEAGPEVASGDIMAEEESPEPAMSNDVAPADAPAPASPTGRVSRRQERESRAQCREVCDLQGAICGLKTHICGLAARHAGDPRYQNACSRATTDCAIASSACNDCSR